MGFNALPLALGLSLLTACASDRHSVEGSIAADQSAEIQVLGEQPRVEIRNVGPGTLSLSIVGPDDQYEAQAMAVGQATKRTMIGPLRVRLLANAGKACKFELVAHGCEGLDANLLAGPAK